MLSLPGFCLSFIQSCYSHPYTHHCWDLTDSSASAGPPSRRRCHSLDSMVAFISHAAICPPLNHKISSQRAPNTFWQDLIYTHHQLEEALFSVTLPGLKPRRPTLSTLLFLHLLPGVRSISCSCWTGCSEFDRPFNGIRPPKIWTNWICCFCGVRTLANTRRTYVQTNFQANMCEQGRLPRWSTFSRNVLWRCEQRALCCVGRKVLRLRNVDSLGISSKWAVQFEQNLRLRQRIISALLKWQASKIMMRG